VLICKICNQEEALPHRYVGRNCFNAQQAERRKNRGRKRTSTDKVHTQRYYTMKKKLHNIFECGDENIFFVAVCETYY